MMNTIKSVQEELEPFGDYSVCTGQGCQHMYAGYTAMYGRYVDLYEKMRVLQDENAALNYDVKYRLKEREVEIQKHKRMFEKERATVEILNNAPDEESLSSDKDTACVHCIKYKNAYMGYRKQVIEDYIKINEDRSKADLIIEQCKDDLMAARKEEGRLRVMLYQKRKDQGSFWENRKIRDLEEMCQKAQERELHSKTIIETLRKENEGLKQRVIASNTTREILEDQMHVIKCERDNLSNKITNHQPPTNSQREIKMGELMEGRVDVANEIQVLQQEKQDCETRLMELSKENEGLKQQLQSFLEAAEEKETNTQLPVIDLREDPQLIRNLKRTFTMMEDGVERESDESALYDAFIDNLPFQEQEATVMSMFKICNEGKQLKEREMKKFRDRTSQVGKKSFAVCLHSIGGRYKYKQSKRVWLNVGRNT